jgi:flagellar export protein FliJ
MKKFRFKFAVVLDLRKRREEDSLRVLAAAQRAHQLELARKAKHLSDLNDSLLRREKLGTDDAASPQAFQTEQSYINGLKQKLIQDDHLIARAARGVEKSMRMYLHARKQSQMIETLKDKDLAQFKKERTKWENKEQDDLSIMRSRFKEEIG